MQMHNDVSHDMKNCDFGFFYTKRYDLTVSETVTMSYKELQKYNNRVFLL